VDKMLAAMPAALRAEWAAFYELDPQGPVRVDAAAASIVAAVLNLFREKHNRPIRPGDLMPDWSGQAKQKPRRRMSESQLRAALEDAALRADRRAK
jgi:hypothetical protein